MTITVWMLIAGGALALLYPRRRILIALVFFAAFCVIKSPWVQSQKFLSDCGVKKGESLLKSSSGDWLVCDPHFQNCRGCGESTRPNN
jgi:hypothetical protein